MGIIRDGRGQPDPYISAGAEVCRYHGSWYSETPGTFIQLFVNVLQAGIPYANASGPTGTVGSTIGDGGTFYCDISVAPDTNLTQRVSIKRDGIVQNSNMQAFKSCAVAAVVNVPQLSNPTQTSLDFLCYWTPNTNVSPAVASLYYKKTTDVSWILHSSSAAQYGTAQKTFSVTVSGLTAGTSYQFYLHVARSVSNNDWASHGTGFLPDANANSFVVSASTVASTPIVTSEAPTSVSYVSVNMQGTIDANFIPTLVNFLWSKAAVGTVAYVTATNPTNGTNLTVGSRVYTFLTALSGAATTDEVLIGADADTTMLSLRHAVNRSGGADGVDYAAFYTGANPDITAFLDVDNAWIRLVATANGPVSTTFSTFTTTEATFTLSTDGENAFAQSTPTQLYGYDGVLGFNQYSFGLDSRRRYFYKAQAVYTANGGGTLYGATITFVTPGDPGPLSQEEEHMQTLQFDGMYATAKTITFTLREPSGTSSDLFYTGAAPASSECLMFQDGVYDSIADNTPAQVGTYLYTLVVSATEMQCETLDLVIHSGSGAFRDQHIQVRTAMRISELQVDASNGPTNASAIQAIGNGNGHGIFASSTGSGDDINAVLSSMWLRTGTAATAGSPAGNQIQLDAGASSTDNFYNGCVVALVGNTGVGQSRVIIGYSGGNRMATVDSAWSTPPTDTTTYVIGPGSRPWQLAPSAELASVPGPTGSYGEMLQLLFQRFAFKINQTASNQLWFNSAADAEVFKRGVSDDGTTQTVETLENA